MLREYSQLVPSTGERTVAPVAEAEPVAAPAPVPAPEPVVDETPSRLAVRVKGAKRCRVRIGDTHLGKTPFAGKPVPPGTHRVYVKRARRPVYSEVLDFYPGEAQTLRLTKAHFKRRGSVARK